ncbi:MAG: hypothetical protein GX672_07645, partial [Synergistaceae bacterium]|nr:hypothetical protein [Synergistaceae bacterium]
MVVICSKDGFNIYRPGQTATEIASRLDCSLFQAALLEMRGVTSETTDSVINSWLCPDMESMLEQLDLGATNSVAVDIFRSLNEKSDVVVYGDYDVDGITATVLA